MVLSGSKKLPPETSEVVSFREKLRRRWELASVLNFLHVFKSLIKNASSISAEEIETALLEQNNILADLHIALLEGIISGSKTLKGSDTWIITLSKTLVQWWPWVAEGDFPLTTAKGEEISTYRELDPITRLLILKALCEVRADQPDAVSYVNESIKDSTQFSRFRKDKLLSSGNGITFWYDGNDKIGYRLYREVQLFENERVRKKSLAQAMHCKWETLATNLEEFKKVVNEFSSSEVKCEVILSRAVETGILPVLEKCWKKKLRAQQRQQREKMLLSGFRNSGIARTCRSQKPVDYRFDHSDFDCENTEWHSMPEQMPFDDLDGDNYDKAITEAIQYANKRKTGDGSRKEEKRNQSRKRMVNGSYNSDTNSRDAESTESDSDCNEQRHDVSHSSHDDYGGISEDDSYEKGHRNRQKVPCTKQTVCLVQGSKGLRFSKRLAGVPDHTIPESVNLGAKNRLRQRPSVNTAVESMVVPDSEDEISSGDME